MIPERRHAQQEENMDSWLMSYADMITLLMCFFIIFVSVSEPKKDKFAQITQGLANKFGSVDLSTPFEGVFRSMQTVIETHQVFKDVAVAKTDKSIDMELASTTFFEPGTATFMPDKISILTELVTALKTASFVEYRIIVEGHTSDAPPVNPALYPTNWELSGARAAAMVRFFIEQGIKPEYLKAVGLGDTQPKVSNKDGAGNPIGENREQNQRIVIKFERVS
jgi:chemotaxis protein MotB